MCKRILMMLILILPPVWSSANEAPSFTASSTIDAVTVFTDRAMVKRVFSGDFPEGNIIVTVPDLPSGVLDQSVRVSGRGTSGAQISAVWVETEYSEKTLSEKIKGLDSELDSLNRREKELTDRLEVLSRKKGFIENISIKTAESISSDITVQRTSAAEWVEMVNFIERELDGISAEKRSIEMEKQSIAEKKDIISKKLAKFSLDATNSSKTAMVQLNLDNPGRFEFNLTYMVYGATWKPVYDIRAKSEADTIDMMMFAEITQNTGEDWKNVNVELTTARPSLGASPPEPTPWIIALQTGGRYQALGGYGSGISLKADRYTTSTEEVDEHMPVSNAGDVLRTTSGFVTQNRHTQWAVSDVSEQLISTAFVLSHRENILGNNNPKKVSVKAVNMVGSTEYFAHPRQNKFAYLKAKLTNKTNFPFLQGAASVFLDGNFVHSTVIPMVVPGEEFDLYLGIDDKIKIDRELVRKYTDESGLLSRKDKLSYSFKITVENFKKSDQKITVLDQYPISQNEQIEVKLLETSPHPALSEPDKAKGFLRWVFNLEPDEKKEISFSYEIKYPDNYVISGLQ